MCSHHGTLNLVIGSLSPIWVLLCCTYRCLEQTELCFKLTFQQKTSLIVYNMREVALKKQHHFFVTYISDYSTVLVKQKTNLTYLRIILAFYDLCIIYPGVTSCSSCKYRLTLHWNMLRNLQFCRTCCRILVAELTVHCYREPPAPPKKSIYFTVTVAEFK